MNSKRFNGAALTRLRKKHLWSKACLGRQVGVSGTAVGTWESGERDPAYSTVIRLAEVLGVSPDTFRKAPK